MKFSWIENYAGTWQDDESRTFMITIRDDKNATVDVLMYGVPMIRPWCGDTHLMADVACRLVLAALSISSCDLST